MNWVFFNFSYFSSLTILHKWNNTYIIIIWPFQLQSVVQLINDTSQSFREGKKWKCNSSCGTRSPRGSNSANKVIYQRVLTKKPLDDKDLEGCTLCLNMLQGCRKVWKSREACSTVVGLPLATALCSLLSNYGSKSDVGKADVQGTPRCRIFGFCVVSFPQNERKIYKLRQLILS